MLFKVRFNYISFVFFVCLVAVFSACNNDLDLIGERREVPIIYCTISPTEPYIYARIERAFADNNISPLEIAKNPDSLYFKDATVSIGLADGSWSVNLERIDAATLGIQRDSGLFPSSPNYVYYVERENFVFNYGEKYVLTILTPSDTFTSETTLLDTIQALTAPRNVAPVGWTPNLTENINNGPIIQYRLQSGISSDAFPRIFNTYIRFNYNERDLNISPVFTPKSFEVPSLKNVVPVNESYRILLNSVYDYLGKNLNYSPTIERYLTSFDIILVYGGKEFEDYNEALAANSGITGSQDFPVFSNIEGGYGIFASRSRQVFRNYSFELFALDSFNNSRFTKHLGFQ